LSDLARADCRYAISGHYQLPPAETLRRVGERAADADRDVYGTGATLNRFEHRVAEFLGKEAAVFMPSGTMAQQILLRIVADGTGNRAFAAHPTTHVVLHEQNGFAALHQMHFVPVGPADAPLTLAHVEVLRDPIATLLLELPQREIGATLPTWNELAAIVAYAKEHGWHLHLDGARLWECGPYYARPYAEIARLFDTVYVSFYKGLGGIAGAMLLGSRALIDEAKIWQRRQGGNLVSLYPYALSAEQAFDDRLDRMASYLDAAQRVAAALRRYPQVEVRSAPPPTNTFHAMIRGDRDALRQRAQKLALDHGIWAFKDLAPTVTPGVFKWEIYAGDATLALGEKRLTLALSTLFT
jgi:threonine aldolase